MNYYPIEPLAFISAERSELSAEENLVRTSELRAKLHENNMKFKQVTGHWKGVSEITFAIHCPTTEALNNIGKLASEYQQDAMLYRDADTNAFLIVDDGTESIGQMVRVPRSEALRQDSWTFDGSTGDYYVVR